MPAIKRSFEETRVPFGKMSFTPDVPSTNLGPNEYNVGVNVETDVRGIRSVSGDEAWGPVIPNNDTPIFVSGGYRQNDFFYYVVATLEGRWYCQRGGFSWFEITPAGLSTTYARNQNITDCWNGTIAFFNDEQNAPMLWPESVNLEVTAATSAAGTSTLTFAAQTIPPFAVGETIEVTGVTPSGFNGTKIVTGCTTTTVSFAGSTAGPLTVTGRVTNPYPQLKLYSQTVPAGISTITYVSATEQQITFDTPYAAAPYAVNDLIVISNVNSFYNGTFRVVSSTTTTVNYEASPAAAYPGFSVGSVAPLYCWNYNPQWKSVFAKWLRLYNTPNVGSILVAGNITATYLDNSRETFANTVQWSQNFGINQAPLTWEPTVLNVANQLEVPLRGEALDAFPCNGNLYLCSYWDTVVFSPINYTTTNTPILGVRLFNQGRGMLTTNCVAIADRMVYGIDARDVWQFDGNNFVGIGNQRVKNWLFNEIDVNNVQRTFMQANTQKNQIEIYYYRVPDPTGTVVATANSGIFSAESISLQVGMELLVSGTLTGTGTITGYSNPTTYWITSIDPNNTGAINEFTMSTSPSGTNVASTAGTLTGLTFDIVDRGTPNRMLSYRYDLEVWNAPRDVNQASFAIESPVRLPYDPVQAWRQDRASRTVMYVRAVKDSQLVQMNQSYGFINSSPIRSSFRRDNIRLSPDYSTKTLVHRILAEAMNLNYKGLPLIPSTAPSPQYGEISIQVEGSGSTGAPKNDALSIVMPIDTQTPWVQINQNANRVNTLEIGHTSDENIWHCAAVTWQWTPTEDDR